jgi:dTDP-glucose 4,6-dehydratase
VEDSEAPAPDLAHRVTISEYSERRQTSPYNRWFETLIAAEIEIMTSMKLFVTGGAGFIGCNFIRYWFEMYPKDTVMNFDLLTYAGDASSLGDIASAAGSRYELVVGDICDVELVGAALSRFGPDAIVNFAAESHNSRAVINPGAFVRANVLGTQTLLDAARTLGPTRFHHISTCEVYGDMALDATTAFTEESSYLPRTPYNASKAGADLLVRAYQLTFGLPATISNCANNYGPFQHPEKVVPLFVTNALDAVPLPLYRQSGHRREWLHVRDHCRAIDAILRNGRIGETYNVGSGEERTIEGLADAVLDATGQPRGLKQYVEDRPGHDRRYLLDHSKITRELGWRPEISFDDGLHETVRWYQHNRPWWAAKKARLTYELDESKWPAANR